MVFRRVLAGILALLFIGVSMVAFVVFAVTNTFFKLDFYREDLREPAYELLVTVTVESISKERGLVNEFFSKAELEREVTAVFPRELFDDMIVQFVEEMEVIKDDPDKPGTFRLGTFRESLLTLAHNLSFRIFETLPKCAPDEVPVEEANGLPSCVPLEVEYNAVSGPLTDEFEEVIYAAIPQQVQFNPNDLFTDMLGPEANLSSVLIGLDTVKMGIYIGLLVLIALIALIIYRPFASIIMVEGVAFAVSGIVGIVVSFIVRMVPPTNFVSVPADREFLHSPLTEFFGAAVELFGLEIQKAALVFLGLGAVLLLVRYYLGRQ